MAKKIMARALAVLGAALLLGACDNFYSTSWGTPRSYKADNIKINASNADTWVEASVGNPELAAALLERIKQDLAKTEQGKPTADQVKLQEAGIKIAIEYSGLGTSVVEHAGDVMDMLSSGKSDEILSALDIIETLVEERGNDAAKNIAEIVSGSLSKETYAVGEVPAFTAAPAGSDHDYYADTAAPGDVAQAVLILGMTVFKDHVDNFSNVNLNDPDLQANIHLRVNEGGKVTVSEGASPEAVALAAYLNLIGDDTSGKFDNNPVTKVIREAFGIGRNAS
jgi:hypothetical protein